MTRLIGVVVEIEYDIDLIGLGGIQDDIAELASTGTAAGRVKTAYLTAQAVDGEPIKLSLI